MHRYEDRPPSTRFDLLSRGGEQELFTGILESFTLSKYDLSSKISHGFRTPLTSVLGFAEVLKEDEGLTEDQREEFTGVIRSELRRLMRFVGLLNDFIDMHAQGIAPDNHEADLLNTMQEAAGEYAEEAENLSIGLIVEGTPQIVFADHKRLGAAVQYLLANALDATPKGGSIILRIEVDGPQSLIRVADTGRGIPEKDKLRVFEPFYRIPRPNDRGSELGLGLSVAHAFIRMHGGTIQVSTREGRGTEMRIELPNRYS